MKDPVGSDAADEPGEGFFVAKLHLMHTHVRPDGFDAPGAVTLANEEMDLVSVKE